MVDISKYMDPLMLAIDSAMQSQAASEPQRDYLGASGIGEECSRKIWYGYKGHKQHFDAKTLRRFEDGHNSEERVLKWLRMVPGIELHTHDENGNQYGFSALDGKFKGHYDGVIRGIPQSPRTWHILEVKCVAESSFKQLAKLKELSEKAALQQWEMRYYAQAMTYCYQEKISRHLLICVTPGARDIMTVRTNADNDFAKAMEAKAKRIIDATDPPERIGGKDYFKCKMCGFRDICHGN